MGLPDNQSFVTDKQGSITLSTTHDEVCRVCSFDVTLTSCSKIAQQGDLSAMLFTWAGFGLGVSSVAKASIADS